MLRPLAMDHRVHLVSELRQRAAEALSYNGLLQSWPEIARLAQEGRLRHLPRKPRSSVESEMTTHSIFPDPEALAALCRRHHIKRLSLFGSTLKGTARPDSDVDLLVEFEPGMTPGFAIVTIKDELSAMLRRKVDLRTPGDLSRYFRDDVLREAQVQYAA